MYQSNVLRRSKCSAFLLNRFTLWTSVFKLWRLACENMRQQSITCDFVLMVIIGLMFRSHLALQAILHQAIDVILWIL